MTNAEKQLQEFKGGDVYMTTMLELRRLEGEVPIL